MASNGLLSRAKTGTCWICQRVRKTDERLKIIGEVTHGYATGHTWECADRKDCIASAIKSLNLPINPKKKNKIEFAIKTIGNSIIE